MFKVINSLFIKSLLVSAMTFASIGSISVVNAEGHGDGGHKQNKMQKMDLNQDGAISKDEFMSYSEKKFSKKDKNGDGVLSQDEMTRKCHRKNKKKQESPAS